MSLAEFKVTVRDQFFVLQLEPERAVEALRLLVPEADAREKLLKELHTIVGAGRPHDGRRTRSNGQTLDGAGRVG